MPNSRSLDGINVELNYGCNLSLSIDHIHTEVEWYLLQVIMIRLGPYNFLTFFCLVWLLFFSPRKCRRTTETRIIDDQDGILATAFAKATEQESLKLSISYWSFFFPFRCCILSPGIPYVLNQFIYCEIFLFDIFKYFEQKTRPWMVEITTWRRNDYVCVYIYILSQATWSTIWPLFRLLYSKNPKATDTAF